MTDRAISPLRVGDLSGRGQWGLVAQIKGRAQGAGRRSEDAACDPARRRDARTRRRRGRGRREPPSQCRSASRRSKCRATEANATAATNPGNPRP